MNGRICPLANSAWTMVTLVWGVPARLGIGRQVAKRRNFGGRERRWI